MKTLVIIPTYNEAANITDVIRRIQGTKLDVDVLVIDDNSPDGTGKIVDNLMNDQVHIIHNQKKSGLGPAYLQGFRWGFDRNYEIFVEMDADGSHQPEELERLIQASKAADLVIGTRWMDGGKVVNWPFHRRLLSRFGTMYARKALGVHHRDLTSGYRALSRALIEIILGSTIETKGYGFQIEIVRVALSHQLKVAEVPITFVERVAGASKMSKRIVIEAFAMTTAWGFRRIVFRR